MGESGNGVTIIGVMEGEDFYVDRITAIEHIGFVLC